MPQNSSAAVSVVQSHVAPSDLSLAIPVVLVLPAAVPEPFVGPEPGASADLQGSRLLQELSLLSAADVATFLESNPAAVDSLLANPPAARAVGIWWSAMDLQHRRAVQEASPKLVGNLEGIPYVTRDVANRQFLTQTMTELNAVISSDDSGRTVVDSAKRQLTMLESISTALGSSQSLPRRTLLSLDVEGQGKAAIVLGDLRTADYVSYLVPGMFFSIENQMSDWTDAAARLHEEELSWLELFGESSSTVATVAWIGYQTPNLTNVGGIGLAEEGRDALAQAIEGLQSVRAADQPYLTIIAHSYGSTAALLALQEYDFEVDALALVGSPGSPAKSVDQLHVRNGNVWVGEAPWDPIPNSAYFGSDPGSASYGAKPMGVGGGLDVITGETLLASSGHNEYFSAGTESMRNFALISIDKGRYVTDGSAADASKKLPVLPHSF
ncbi:alpha/beta hydrolase [Salinibacterium soli]|uniref:Alpha/beta hydrolase n=1 Tax=Antiquaquibacter soli TaxID=3064523 RepID=A0ABT9BN41_9MICO|nr:alpha/beta hydrolase [Protaetiibacter sp. WY-16]MDO7882456.1 alpha/beta hydrolase [Protaetiibacter sp. WY-16]